MARVDLDPKYSELSDRIIQRFHERDIILSSYAEVFLRYSVEAWHEDTPLSHFKGENEVDLQDYANRIVDEVLKDPHVVKKRRARFKDMLVALSDSGKKILEGVFDKGF